MMMRLVVLIVQLAYLLPTIYDDVVFIDDEDDDNVDDDNFDEVSGIDQVDDDDR